MTTGENGEDQPTPVSVSKGSPGRRRKLSKGEINSLLAMYRHTNRTAAEIAQYHGIHPSLVTYLVKRAGLPLRGRGSRPHPEPSLEAQQALLEAWTNTYAAAAARCKVSKQYIWRLAQRWEAWATTQFGPRAIKRAAPQGKQQHCPAKPVRPHVISFRVTNSELVSLHLQLGGLPGSRAHSPHSAARFHLLRSLGLTPGEYAESQTNIGQTP